MTEPTLASDLALARSLADMADEISLDRFRSADLVVTTKPDMTPVSDADQAVENALRAAIQDSRPGDSIRGEEFGVEGDSRRQWIVDPIDGTKNYVRGVPVWATLIALAIDGEPVRGRGQRAGARQALVGVHRRRRVREREARVSPDSNEERRIHVSQVAGTRGCLGQPQRNRALGRRRQAVPGRSPSRTRCGAPGITATCGRT